MMWRSCLCFLNPTTSTSFVYSPEANNKAKNIQGRTESVSGDIDSFRRKIKM